MTRSLAALFLVLGAFFDLACARVDGRGFGDQFEWHGLEEGTSVAKAEKKPMMIVIHKTWCGACKALKPQFAASKEIEALSKHFVLVNIQDDEEPQDAAYKPDGGYIPRILFANRFGRVDASLVNEGGNDKYKYYYYEPTSIARSMERAVRRFSPKTDL